MRLACLLGVALLACSAENSKDDTSLVDDTGADTARGDASDTGVTDVGFNVDASTTEVTMEPATDVEVVITSDNAYSFGWGDKSTINTFNFRSPSVSAGQIFNCGEGPEEYVIPAADAASKGPSSGMTVDSSTTCRPKQRIAETPQPDARTSGAAAPCRNRNRQ